MEERLLRDEVYKDGLGKPMSNPKREGKGKAAAADEKAALAAARAAVSKRLAVATRVCLGGVFYVRNEAGGWAEEEMPTLEADVLSELVVELGEGVPTPRLRDATLALLEMETLPEAQRVLPPDERSRPFNLDSGEVLRGTPFAGEVVWVDGDGEIRRRPLGERDFYRATLPYALPKELRDAPAYERWRESTFASADEARLFEEVCGAALLAEGIDDGEQIIVVQLGEGGSGKGTALRLQLAVFGARRVKTYELLQDLAGRFAFGDIEGKLAMHVGDLESPTREKRGEFMTAAARLKALTGREGVRVERKNVGEYGAHPTTIPFLNANHVPRFVRGAEDASAWERRMLFVDYGETIDQSAVAESDRDGAIEAAMREELPQVARRWVEAFGRRVARAEFTKPASHVRAMAKMLEGAQGELEQWLKEHTEADVDAAVPTADVLAGCRKSGVDASAQALATAVVTVYGDKVGKRQVSRDGRRVMRFVGLALRDGPRQTGLDRGAAQPLPGECDCGSPSGDPADHASDCVYTANKW